MGAKFCSDTCARAANQERWHGKQGAYMRSYLYGVTPERMAEMLTEQDGRCAICRTDSPGGKGDWHVDHCHATNRVRGLLCHRCNLGLGMFRDSAEFLTAAIDYLGRANVPTPT